MRIEKKSNTVCPKASSGCHQHLHSPLVSVIIATYNRAELIGETIESVLQQTFSDFELIIVSDGSTDHTEKVVLAYKDPRVHYLRQDPSGRPAVPRNRGIREARGKYIAFCDDDDIWFPEKLQKQMALMESKQEVALCYTNGTSFSGEKVISEWMFSQKVFSGHFNKLLRGNFIPNSSVILKKKLIEQLGLLNEDMALKAVEDFDMWLRMAFSYRVVYIDERLIKYRIHSGGIGSNPAESARKNILVLIKWLSGNKEKRFLIFYYLLIQLLRYGYFKTISGGRWNLIR